MNSNLAEQLTPETEAPILPLEDLARYAEVKSQISALSSESKVLNARFKDKLGQFLVQTNDAAIEAHRELVERFVSLEGELATIAETGEHEDTLPQVEMAYKACKQDLLEAGVTQEMINNWLKHDPVDMLKHTKVNLDIGGYLVSTSVQDKSKLNQEKAVAYLKAIGRSDLVKTIEVVDEPALEVALYNGEIPAANLKGVALEENLIVAMTVKPPKGAKKNGSKE